MSLVAALCNGAPAASVDLADRGLHYGDGVFRTVRVVDGKPQGWPHHMARLTHDCERLALPRPDVDALGHDFAALFEGGASGVGKIVLTRGAGGRGYTPPALPAPTRLVLRYPPPEHPAEYAQDGVAVGVSGVRLARQPALAGVKHLNRLEQVLARRECRANDWPEALMTTDDGRVVCGVMTNLFVVHGDRIATPAIRDAGVMGATRQRLIDGFSSAGRPVVETDFSLADILGADEVFLCNSAMPVWPVRAVGDQRIAVGPVSEQARAMLGEAACGD